MRRPFPRPVILRHSILPILIVVGSSTALGQCPRARLAAPDRKPTDRFGIAVAIDGDLVLVGNYGGPNRPGRAYTFDAETGGFLRKLVLPPDQHHGAFGYSVDLDAGLAVVGDRGGQLSSGALHVFRVGDGAHLGALTVPGLPPGTNFGGNVAVSGTGVVGGAPWHDGGGGAYSGAAYLFDVSAPGSWVRLTPSESRAGDAFGSAVAITERFVAVSAPATYNTEGAVYVFDRAGNQRARLTPSYPTYQFGRGLAADSGRLLVGGEYSYLFDLATGEELLVIRESHTVGALTGTSAVLGTFPNVVSVFDTLTGRKVGESHQWTTDSEGYGKALDARGRRIVVGAPTHEYNEEGGGGRAYLVDLCPRLGASYCGPAVPNTDGYTAEIAAYGSDRVADSELFLTASGMPDLRPGYFLASQATGFVRGPGGSDGNLCLGGKIVRRLGDGGVLRAGTDGSFTKRVDPSWLPAAPGETWHFQAWYRDGDIKPWSRSNFTDGLTLTFR